MAYLQSRQDFEYLESFVLLDDAVEIDAMVFELMRSPTRKKAQSMYEGAIALWFEERKRDGYHSHDKRLHSIAERHGHKLSKVPVMK